MARGEAQAVGAGIVLSSGSGLFGQEAERKRGTELHLESRFGTRNTPTGCSSHLLSLHGPVYQELLTPTPPEPGGT